MNEKKEKTEKIPTEHPKNKIKYKMNEKVNQNTINYNSTTYNIEEKELSELT